MTKHLDRDNRRFDDESNTRPTGSNYISVDRSDDGLDRRGFLFCMAWADTATVWALSGGIPKSFAIGGAGLLSESEKKSIFSRSSATVSTPIVLFAHVPLWTVYPASRT